MGPDTEQLRPWLVLGQMDIAPLSATLRLMKNAFCSHALLLLAGLLLTGPATPVVAADFSDPTWPCIQRKVENLSTGLMWPHPAEPIELAPDQKEAVDELVGRLTLRRIAVEELTPNVTAFTTAYGNDTALLGHVFADTFDKLSQTRGKIIRGIEGYSLQQIALAEKIDATRARMDDLMTAENPDFDQVDALEEQLDWDERIFTDRAQSLTYVCETPVIIEKRLFAIAQMLLAEVAE
ncbi:hypothetical protein [uncultured Roseovarius sp.]|uniref:hypothetical protein n=1 Tax=uncultured Roseovarius sp. TaxID=293344 RepID=UPI002604AB38|nr:hypothetical protein [uncultured Roseovarius sp.]